MNILFNYYQYPNEKEDTEVKHYYPRPFCRQTIDTDEIAASIGQYSSFTGAEIKAICEMLISNIKEEILRGNNVRIAGLGVISISLGSKLLITDPDKTQTVHLYVKRLGLRCDPKFLKKLRNCNFIRASKASVKKAVSTKINNG